MADKKLFPALKDVFTLLVDNYPEDAYEVFMKFLRDRNGKITLFTVSDPRLMGHRFDRINWYATGLTKLYYLILSKALYKSYAV